MRPLEWAGFAPSLKQSGKKQRQDKDQQTDSELATHRSIRSQTEASRGNQDNE